MRIDPEQLKVRLLSTQAQLPVKGSAQAAGFDIFSAEDTILQAGTHQLIYTDIAVEIPQSLYGQLKPRSRLALKHRLSVDGGVIDSDYRAEVGVMLENKSDEDHVIHCGDRIAQLIIFELPLVTIEQSEHLTTTAKNTGGFGSTGKAALVEDKSCTPQSTNDVTVTKNKPNAINKEITSNTQPMLRRSRRIQCLPTTAQAATLHLIQDSDNDIHFPICNIELSNDPFVDTEAISFAPRGNGITQGLQLQDSLMWNNIVEITGCRLGTATRRIHKWRKRLKDATLLKINNIEVTSSITARKILQEHWMKKSKKNIQLTLAVDEQQSIHYEEGVPIMYFDQLSTIADHLNCIKQNTGTDGTSKIQKIESNKAVAQSYLKKMQKAFETYGTLRAAKGILSKNQRHSTKLTRKKLQLQPDWEDW